MPFYPVKPVLFAIVFASCLFLASAPTIAQVTPNELSRLSLEKLLDLDMGDISGERRWFINYEFRLLDAAKYQQGTKRLSFDDVLWIPGEVRTDSNFPVVPTFVKQSIHVLSVGRELSDRFSLGVSVPLVKQETEYISTVDDFDEFAITSQHIGDISVFGQYLLQQSQRSNSSFGLAISLPHGSIDEMGDTPRNGAGTLERLPYTMQIGSGTYDFTLSLSHDRKIADWSVGAKLASTIRTGRNKNNYRLGDNYGAELSARYEGWHTFLPGIFANARYTGHIQGRDESLLGDDPLFPFPSSLSDPHNYGGEKVKAGASVKICLRKKCSASMEIKAAVPLYQNLRSIQIRERFDLSTSVNFSF